MLREKTIAAACGLALAAGGAAAWAQDANTRANYTGAAATAQSTEALVNELNEARAELERARQQLEQAARGVAVASAAPFQRVVVAPFEPSALVIRSSQLVLGVTLSADNRVEAVQANSPAAAAGIQVGDVIRSFNGEPIDRAGILEQLASLSAGDTIQLGIERDGEQLELAVEPHASAFAAIGVGPSAQTMRNIVVRSGDGPVQVFSAAPSALATPAAPATPATPAAPAAPAVPGRPAPAPAIATVLRTFSLASAPLSDMELVPMTEGLGRYFGTSDGLLVVRGPQSDEIDIDDGDVILSVNGRKPSSPEHALRILASYEPGETIVFSIMRNRQEVTVEFVVPEGAQPGTFVDTLRLRER